MTKKDSSRRRRTHASQTTDLCVSSTTDLSSRRDLDVLNSSLESCSMVTLTDRVESWLQLSESTHDMMLARKSGGAGMTSSELSLEQTPRKTRPIRRKARPVWNDSTCIPPKPRSLSKLPVLPTHGFDCGCVGCERINKSRVMQKTDTTQNTVILPAIAPRGHPTGKHTRSSTFPSDGQQQGVHWGMIRQQQPTTYTQSQLITSDRVAARPANRHLPSKSLPGIPQSELTRSFGPLTDRQAELLMWANDNKVPQTLGGRTGEVRVRKQRPLFGRPSNIPPQVEKPVVGARLPRLGGLTDSTVTMATIHQSGSGNGSSVQASTPSVCLRVEKPAAQHVQQSDAGRTEDDDNDSYSMDSFYSESLSDHGVDTFSLGDVQLDSPYDESTPIPNARKPHLQTTDEGCKSGSPRDREQELQELEEFGQWADRFGGGMKGLSIASLIQDCRVARQDGQHAHGNRSHVNVVELSRPSLTAMLAAQNVEKKVQTQQHQRHKLMEIERIRCELHAMQQRHALQQQESAIQNELRQSMVFKAVGGPGTDGDGLEDAPIAQATSETASMEDTISRALATTTLQDN